MRPISPSEALLGKKSLKDLDLENLDIKRRNWRRKDFERNYRNLYKSILGFLANLQGRPMISTRRTDI